MKRQNVRKLLLIISMLLFPVTIFYFSPVLIIGAGLEGIINGSFIVFILMLLLSIFFGRIFCSYLCPGGGLQECAFSVNSKPPKLKWRRNIKYVIWIIWVVTVIFCYINKGEIIKIDVLYQTEYGISISNVFGYIIYYGIICLIVIPALICGKRAFCYYFCWMAPFMVIGTKLSNILHLPTLHISTDKSKCNSCKRCNKSCPMSIDVEQAIHNSTLKNTECIQCGACIDICPQKALCYRMKNKN